MAAEFKIGRLRYNWQGVWTPGNTYARDDVVQNDGRAYVCLVPGVASTNFYTDYYATFPVWQQMTDGKSWTGAWLPSTVYGIGDTVLFGGKAYYCSTNHTSGSLFETNSANWTEYTEFAGWHISWTPNTEYGLNDVVKYGGIVYKCIANHVSAASNNLGLEANQSAWTIFYAGVEYKSSWQSGYRYKANDLVKLGGDIYSCVNYNSDPSFVAANWVLWLPGTNFALIYQLSTTYQLGDIVIYGGDAYISKIANNIGHSPASNPSSWALFNVGYAIRGAWSSASSYAPGDVVNRNGMLYEAINDNSNQDPSTGTINLTYIAAGSSGTTILVSPTTTAAAGMFISGTGIKQGQRISTVGSTVSQTGSSLTLNLDNTGSISAISGNQIGVLGATITANSWFVGSTVTFANGSTATIASVNAGSNYIQLSTSVTLTPQQAWPLIITSSDFVAASTTLVLDKAPEGTLSNGQSLAGIGVNSAYWSVVNISTQWTGTWTGGTIQSPKSYVVGDIVVWSNGTYVCVQDHAPTIQGQSNRPDADTTNQYWVLLVAHNRNNALNTLGDLETYTTGPNYTAVPIGTQSYNLRVNTNVPNWQKINVVPAVYYVDTFIGVDSTSYGTTWDQPFKTISYACNFIGQGAYFPNATASLTANKGWMITEMYQWMLYQMNNSIAPFSPDSLWDPFYTQRDAGYVIDAIIYDMQRGGNSQTVAATLRWFYYGSQTVLANSLIEAAIAYFPPPLTYLLSLMQSVVSNTAPAASYQTLNGISGASYVNQTFTGLNAETGTATEISSLMAIPITALTNQNTYAVPSSNSGLTAILNVKTGTYNEKLPIIVPENLSIVGDELRSVTVQPATSISVYCTQTAAPNTITLTSTTGLTDGMPLQFISPFVNNASTTFGNVTSGQTYYVVGSSISGNTLKLNDGPTFTFTGTIVNASNIISNVSKISNLVVGMTITGNGIQTGTTVTAFSQAISGIATITMSQTATISVIGASFTASGNLVTVTNGTGNMLVYAGDCLKNMWLMRNGTTMRNLSNFGLLGTLTATNTYGTARPTGGSYTSLDPGNGPDDTSVWIIRRSPYIQNVTNFGTGCAGAKVDGTLHNGGTKAMLHNDYTQVLSDGIGVWITGPGAISECVSVFSYYNYIGHFAENGGRIRSTNGNSSYGTFGVVSEGYDTTEVPITGTIFNQSQQVQASVSQAFGTTDQILKLNYSNAGSAYYLPATNMLQYSNNFTAGAWTNDGNISFIKNETAPTGYTEGWLLTGSGNTAGAGYIQQTVNINPAGYTYSGLTGTTQNGAPGNGAKFNVTVTSTAYVITVDPANPGTLYQVGNTIVIKGSVLGGQDGSNDLTVTVATLTGTGILTLNTPTGTVPTGSNQTYTLSVYVYAGTSPTVDLQAIFTSGSTTITSGISYNVSSNVVTPYSGQNLSNSTNGGQKPAYYGAQKTLVAGWYRVWLAVNDITGTYNTVQFKLFPQGANSPASGTYSIFYGAQLELSGTSAPPDFYLETTTGMYTAYANFEINGAGTGALLSGDEVRSQSVFNARITTDTNGITGGSGYATSQNTAQFGNSYSIQLAQSDPGLYNYLNMRIVINSGTGAGQYGYIAYYNSGAVTDASGILSKTALVLSEEVDSLSVVQSTYSSTAANNLLTIASGTDISKIYVNMPVQFVPTYYIATVASSSTGTILAIATQGGTVNQITVNNAEDLALNQAIVFSGSGFNITAGYTYYIVFVDYTNNLIQISASLYGQPIQLSNVLSGSSMTITYPNYSGYLAGSTTNMKPNIPVQFTGYAIGGVTLGTTYYVQDIIDSNNFTISSSVQTLTVSATTAGTGIGYTSAGLGTVSASTSSLIPLNPVVFSGTIFDSAITSGQAYYISNIVDASTFTLSTNITRLTVTATTFGSNLITLSSVSNLITGNPIIFYGIPSGQTQGNLVPEHVYYIQTINAVTKQITVTDSDKVNTFVLTTTGGAVGGQCFARTCDSTGAVYVGGGSPAGGTSMTVTTTGTKLVVSNSIGATSTMNATFSNTLFGGLNSYTIYYITAINPGTNPTVSVSTTLAGTPVTLSNALGNMQMAASGWDNINPGTPSAASLDTTSVYYIEPRTVFTEPPNSQVVGSVSTPLAVGNSWKQIAYGNNYFLAIPTTGATGAASSDGVAWTSVALPTTVSSWTSIAFGNFYWIALGTTGASTSVAAYSNSNGAGWRTASLPSNTTWSSIVYGNGIFVAIATGTASAAYTTNFGRTWNASATGLLATKTWVGLSYGTGIFLAIASDGTGAWSLDGNTWQATTLPQSTALLSGINITGSQGTFTCTKTTSQLVIGQTVVISGTNGGSGSVTNGTYYIIATNGSTTFTLGATPGAGTGISTTAGTPNSLTFLLGAAAYSALAWGNNRFVAMQSGTGLYSAYSFNGKVWYQTLAYTSATAITYGQGTFVAVNSSSTTAYKSRGGLYWTTRTLQYGSINCIGFGYNTNNIGVFPTLASTGSSAGNASAISEGIRAQGRTTVTSSVITAVSLWETGSNYSSTPTVSFQDLNVSVQALVSPRTSNGTLSNPTFVSRGSGYNTTSTVVTITGNGYADTYQTGYTLVINNLASLPLVGSNLSIAGNSQVYKVTSAVAVYGTQAPFIEANVQISPTMSTALSPANGAVVSLRQLYSQCRLTNHDFLSIGVGNYTNTNYPNVNELNALPQNEAVETHQGHVFYTSTDENGNFLVGGLFGVQQATGTVTLSATQFGLQGLSQLSLGGIAVGGSSVVVTQFSTDPTFVANSDAVIPTQRSIKSYLTGRLSQGGANTFTGQLIAGTVEIGGAIYIKSSVPNGTAGSVIKMASKVNISGKNASVDGNIAALDMFIRSGSRRS